MSKSTYTLNEVIQFIIKGVRKYFPTGNFDKQEIRQIIRQGANSVFDVARDNKLDKQYFVTAYALTHGGSVGGVSTYTLAPFASAIVEALFVQGNAGSGRIELIDIGDLIGAAQNMEFNDQPVAAIQGEALKIYWGQRAPETSFLYAVARPVIPTSYVDFMSLPDDLVSMIIAWSVRQVLMDNKIPIPAEVQLRVDEEFKLLQAEKGEVEKEEVEE